MALYQSQYKQQVVKVTQWKAGCVYKTKVVGTVWLSNDRDYTGEEKNAIAKEHGGDILNSMPTADMANYDNCFRSVKEGHPDFIIGGGGH